jgi:hypothetical protein
MEVPAHPALGLALDGEPVALAVGGVRQAVVAVDRLAVDDQAHADILAGLVVCHRAAVLGLEHEGANHRALLPGLGNAEAAGAAPAARAALEGQVAMILQFDQQAGQLLVEVAPGGGDLRGHRLTQYLTDGRHQAFADDGVLLRRNAQRDVLADHRGQGLPGLLRVAAQLDIGQHGAGQGAGLAAALLVGLVEQRLHFGVAGKHQRIEALGDGVEVLGHHGCGGVDQLLLLCRQHGCPSVRLQGDNWNH